MGAHPSSADVCLLRWVCQGLFQTGALKLDDMKHHPKGLEYATYVDKPSDAEEAHFLGGT